MPTCVYCYVYLSDLHVYLSGILYVYLYVSLCSTGVALYRSSLTLALLDLAVALCWGLYPKCGILLLNHAP